MSKPPAPVRIKLYGMLWLTRRGSRLMVMVGGGLLAAVMVYWLVTPRLDIPPDAMPGTQMLLWIWIYLPWLVLAGVLLAALEVWLVLRKFDREEAAQRAGDKQGPRSSS